MLKTLTERHNGMFFGDDMQMGLLLPGQWRMSRFYFRTEVPETLLGESPNLYQQRVRSWDQAPFLFPWILVLKPLLFKWIGPGSAILKSKNSQLYTLYSTLMQIFRYPLIALIIKKSLEDKNNFEFLYGTSAVMISHTALGLAFNYCKLPPNLRSDLRTVLTFPIYQLLLSVLGTLAFVRVLLVTGPNTPHPRSFVFQREHGDLVIPDSSLLPIPSDDDAIVRPPVLGLPLEDYQDRTALPSEIVSESEATTLKMNLPRERDRANTSSRIRAFTLTPPSRIIQQTSLTPPVFIAIPGEASPSAERHQEHPRGRPYNLVRLSSPIQERLKQESIYALQTPYLIRTFTDRTAVLRRHVIPTVEQACDSLQVNEQRQQAPQDLLSHFRALKRQVYTFNDAPLTLDTSRVEFREIILRYSTLLEQTDIFLNAENNQVGSSVPEGPSSMTSIHRPLFFSPVTQSRSMIFIQRSRMQNLDPRSLCGPP